MYCVKKHLLLFPSDWPAISFIKWLPVLLSKAWKWTFPLLCATTDFETPWTHPINSSSIPAKEPHSTCFFTWNSFNTFNYQFYSCVSSPVLLSSWFPTPSVLAFLATRGEPPGWLRNAQWCLEETWSFLWLCLDWVAAECCGGPIVLVRDGAWACHGSLLALAVSRLGGGWILWWASCPAQEWGLSMPFGPCLLVSFELRVVCVLGEGRVGGFCVLPGHGFGAWLGCTSGVRSLQILSSALIHT